VSRTVTLDGVSYTLPTTGERDWSTNLNALLVALAEGVDGLLNPDGAVGSIVHFAQNTIPADTTPRFMWPWADNDAWVGVEQVILVPVAGTLSKLRVRHDTIATDVNTAFTVRKNGIDTALTCTIAAAGQAASDTTNSVAVAAGDRVSVKIVNSGVTATTATGPRASMLFVPDAEEGA